MGASESMFSGVSGLDNHQTWMNIIGNNIANVNTAGFKDQQFNFATLISQTLKGATSSTVGGPGGTDFEQVGLGTQSGSVTTNEQEGSLQTTNLPTDFAIQGDGFFIVNDGQGNHFTRDSNFIVDGFGNINSAATGFHLQGYGLKQSGNTVAIDTSKVVNLAVPQTINPAQQTNVLDLLGNIQSSSTTAQTQSVGVYDSLGQLHNVVLTFAPPTVAGGNWLVTAGAADLQPGSSISVSGGNAASFTTPLPGTGQAGLHFNALGQLDGTITPLYISFTNGVSGGSALQPQPPQPWIIPGTTTNTNAVQATVQLNLVDNGIGLVTSFASASSLATQAVANSGSLTSTTNNNMALTGNLESSLASQVETLTLAGPAVATDTFELTFNGQTTATARSVGTTATAANLQADLEALTNIGVGNVTVAGATGGPYTITFTGALANQAEPKITVTPVAVTTTTFAPVITTAGSLNPPGTSNFIFNAADSKGLTHSYTMQMSPLNTTTGTTWTPHLLAVNGEGQITGNLQSTAATASLTFKQPDGTGTLQSYTLTFTKVAPGNWTVATSAGALSLGGAANIFQPGNQQATLTTGAGQVMNLDFSQITSNTNASSVAGSATPFGDTGLAPIVYAGGAITSGGTQTLTIPGNVLNDTNTATTVVMDFSKITNTSAPAGITPPSTGSNGNSAGSLKDFNVDQNGVLHGVYTNGFTQTIGQVLLATFENPGGLQSAGNNVFDTSANSGVTNVGIPGSGRFGTLAEGNIETSNVDLATEFSNMILAERGFQANSRIITTSDQMLQDVVALKQ